MERIKADNVIFSDDTLFSGIGDKIHPSEDRTILHRDYIDEYMSIKVFLIRLRLDVDGVVKVNRKWLSNRTPHPDFWNEYFFPIIMFKLNRPIPPDDESYEEESRFVKIILDVHDNFDIKYFDPEKGIALRKFHISKRVYEVWESFVADMNEIEQYLDSDYPESPLLLYREIKDCLRTHVDLDSWQYVGEALYCFLTHSYTFFNIVPYLLLLSHSGSGKSRNLKILTLLSKDGISFLNPTSASIFRTVESLQPTLGIDQGEKLKSNRRDPSTIEIINLLNSGYEKGGLVPRANPNKANLIEHFRTFCPKIICSTGEIDEVLSTRCLNIPILRTLNMQKYATKEPNPALTRPLNLRLSFFSIDHGCDMYHRYIEEDLPEDYTELLELSTPRLRQLIFPLLLIASEIGIHQLEGEFENLRRFIEYQNQIAESQSLSSAGQRVFVALYQMMQERHGNAEITDTVTVSEIRSNLDLETESEKKYFSPIRIGLILKNFQLDYRVINGKKYYTINVPKLSELAQRYNINLSEEQEDRPKEVQQFISKEDD